MIPMNRAAPLIVCSVTLVLAGADMSRVDAAKPATETWVTNLYIDAGTQFPVSVFPVGRTETDPEPAWYLDYRHVGGDMCVAGDPYPGGLAFIQMNRRIPSDGPRCSEVAAPARQFGLTIESAEACAALELSGPVCEVITSAGPEQTIIRAETVFKQRATSTMVTMYFIINGIHYAVTTDTPARVISFATVPNVKVVESPLGTATLSKGNAKGTYDPVASFSLPFRFEFNRQAIAPQF